MTVRIDRLEAVHDARSVASLQRLLAQLSSSAPPLTAERLGDVIGNDACMLFVARDDDGEIVGMLTLAVFPIPSGVRAWIEDVVVDDGARGHGIGSALVHHAIDAARSAGARTVELTSRPSRTAANALYLKRGFAERETNVYRYELG